MRQFLDAAAQDWPAPHDAAAATDGPLVVAVHFDHRDNVTDETVGGGGTPVDTSDARIVSDGPLCPTPQGSESPCHSNVRFHGPRGTVVADGWHHSEIDVSASDSNRSLYFVAAVHRSITHGGIVYSLPDVGGMLVYAGPLRFDDIVLTDVDAPDGYAMAQVHVTPANAAGAASQIAEQTGQGLPVTLDGFLYLVDRDGTIQALELQTVTVTD